MSFKNKKGDVPWYVIALILALVVLVVSLFAIPKIREAQNQTGGSLRDTCTIAGGECFAAEACTIGTQIPALCPDAPAGTQRVCCKE